MDMRSVHVWHDPSQLHSTCLYPEASRSGALPLQTRQHDYRRKKRPQIYLTVSNLKFDDMFADVFVKSARSITEYILAHPGKTFTTTLDLIRAVPGFDKNLITVITVIAEIDIDMSVFPSAKNPVSWAGCCPARRKRRHNRRSSRHLPG